MIFKFDFRLNEPPRLLKAFLLWEAIKSKDWTTIQQLSRSPDRAIQGMAYEAADIVCQRNSMGTGNTIERDFSTITHG